jgi:monoterpene epsilon-lactone hydrolase
MSNAHSDLVLPAPRCHKMAQLYLAGHDFYYPRVLWVYGDFTGTSPVF